MPALNIYLDEVIEERQREERRRWRKRMFWMALVALVAGGAAFRQSPKPKVVIQREIVTVPYPVEVPVKVPTPERTPADKPGPTPSADKKPTDDVTLADNVTPTDDATPADDATLIDDPLIADLSAGNRLPDWTTFDADAGDSTEPPTPKEIVESQTPIEPSRHLCVTPKHVLFTTASHLTRQPVTVSNSSTEPVRITSVRWSTWRKRRSGFSVDAGDCVGKTLRPGELCTVGVRIDTKVFDKGDSVTILVSHDAPGELETMTVAAMRKAPTPRPSRGTESRKAFDTARRSP